LNFNLSGVLAFCATRGHGYQRNTSIHLTMVAKQKQAKRPVPARQDGLETRRQLLEAAGEIFAEHGYAKATSKEICERAKANIAAVNYHFGGKDELYAAVLEEAHSRIVSIEAVAAAAQSRIEPALKLRMFLSRIVAEVCKSGSGGWELRVLSREVLSRSPMMAGLVQNQIAPKAKYVRAIVGELMQLPADDPAVSRVLVNLIGPILMLLITDRSLQKQVVPKLELDVETLTEHMITYALAGIDAVAKQRKTEKGRR
jgi:TetR/AcrR family transcriptional regulator, regulator of cefoperazone and chloramphenicol sensitivity